MLTHPTPHALSFQMPPKSSKREKQQEQQKPKGGAKRKAAASDDKATEKKRKAAAGDDKATEKKREAPADKVDVKAASKEQTDPKHEFLLPGVNGLQKAIKDYEEAKELLLKQDNIDADKGAVYRAAKELSVRAQRVADEASPQVVVIAFRDCDAYELGQPCDINAIALPKSDTADSILAWLLDPMNKMFYGYMGMMQEATLEEFNSAEFEDSLLLRTTGDFCHPGEGKVERMLVTTPLDRLADIKDRFARTLTGSLDQNGLDCEFYGRLFSDPERKWVPTSSENNESDDEAGVRS